MENKRDMKEHCIRAYKKQHERLKWLISEGTGEKNIVRLYEKDTNKTQNKPMETTCTFPLF